MRNTKRTTNKQDLSKTESTSTCTLGKNALFPFISFRFVFVKSSCFVSFRLVFSLLFCSVLLGQGCVVKCVRKTVASPLLSLFCLFRGKQSNCPSREVCSKLCVEVEGE